MMRRRDFLTTAGGAGISLGMFGGLSPAQAQAQSKTSAEAACGEPFPKAQRLTAQVAEFSVNTQLSDVPEETIELGKKSLLDGLGLALSGSKAETGALIQKYEIGRAHV